MAMTTTQRPRPPRQAPPGSNPASRGLILVVVIWQNWEVCVRAAKLAGAAQAATAAVGVALVGVTLLYAGMRKTAVVARA